MVSVWNVPFFLRLPRLTWKIGFTHRVSQQTRPAPLYVSPLPQVPTSNVDEQMLRDILPCLEKNTQISHNWWYEKEVKRIKWKKYRRSTNNENDGCFINSDHSVQLLCEITMIHYHLINRTDQINYPIKYYIPLLSTSPIAKSFITSTFIWMNQPALTSIHPNFL